MTSLAEDLRTFLLADSTITKIVDQRVHQDHMPEVSKFPAIWFSRQATDSLLSLDSKVGLVRSDFALECISGDMGVREDLSSAVFDKLHGYRGAVGTRSVQGIFVTDQDDTYELRNDLSDFGIGTAALRVSIWST